MANPHHDAAADHQWSRGKTKLFGPKEGGDEHVAPGLELTVALHDDAIAQTVEQQRLLRLRQTKFPRAAGVLE